MLRSDSYDLYHVYKDRRTMRQTLSLFSCVIKPIVPFLTPPLCTLASVHSPESSCTSIALVNLAEPPPRRLGRTLGLVPLLQPCTSPQSQLSTLIDSEHTPALPSQSFTLPPTPVTATEPAEELETSKDRSRSRMHLELEHDIRTDLSDPEAALATSAQKRKFIVFSLSPCDHDDCPDHVNVLYLEVGEYRGYRVPWTGHYILGICQGENREGLYPVQHGWEHRDDWYNLGRRDDGSFAALSFANFPGLDLNALFTVQGVPQEPEPEPYVAPQEEGTSKGKEKAGPSRTFTEVLGSAIQQVEDQERPDTPSTDTADQEQPMATQTHTITLAPGHGGHLGIGTGATFASIARINAHAPAEPLPHAGGRLPFGWGRPNPPAPPPAAGGGGPPGGGGGTPPGGGGAAGGGPAWPFGMPQGPGFNLNAPVQQGDIKLG